MYFEKAKTFLTSPSKGFDAEKKTDIIEAFKYMLVMGLIVSILNGLVSAAFVNVLAGLMPGYDAILLFGSGPMLFVVIFVITYLMIIVGSVIWSLWLHLWAYVFGAKKGLNQTMKSVFYGQTPYYLIGWIPFINIVAVIWELVLDGLGLVRLHGITGGKAALSVIIAILIPVIVIGLLVMTALVTLGPGSFGY